MRRFFAPLVAVALGLAVAAAIVLTGDPADAKSSYDSPYGFERTWNAALRMVRVDMGLKVTEKDETVGYLLFDYKSTEGGSKTSGGSIEFIRSKEPEAPVRVVVQLASMPRYHEQIIVDTLAKKMRTEYGDPPPRKPAAPTPADAGAADAGESASY